MQIILGAVSIVLTFGIAVFVHEFGHYIFARIRGIGVEAFAIGMGPKIAAWTRGGTEYSIRWLPIGGFVKLHQMVREEAEEVEAARAEAEAAGDKEKARSIGEAAHEDMAALYNAGLLTKILVFTGGVFMNFVAATVAMAFYWWIGFSQQVAPENWLGNVNEDSALAQAGVRNGDYVVALEGEAVENQGEFSLRLKEAFEAGATRDGLDFKVERGDEVVQLSLPAVESEEALKDAARAFSAAFAYRPFVGGVIPFSPAAKAGLKEGDHIVAINDKPIERWGEMTEIIRAHPEEPIVLTVERRGKDKPLPITLLPQRDPANPEQGQIGIVLGSGKYERVRDPFVKAAALAPIRTWNQMAMIVTQTVSVLTQSNFEQIKQGSGGPIAIATITYQQAQKGFSDAVRWFIMLNLLLAFFNLLPIPVLDGGFIVLSFIEAIIRRPVPTKILTPIYTFFALCFITLFVLISYQDIMRALF